MIILLGFSVRCPKLSGINQAKAYLKELVIQRVWSGKVQSLWDSELGSSLFTNWVHILIR